ncbi:MAG TPA: DUF853 domain-containing protein [Coriobacteriia bacterium]|nr:DUF853 domain-containing protein [Coriobacteriia bacterium]
MYLSEKNVLWIGQNVADDTQKGRICLNLKRANRHGLITGATGTGKTATLKTLAEGFSDAGVPVFLCDVKGDVSGLCMPGEAGGWAEKSAAVIGIEGWSFAPYPVRFWDVFGKRGVPVRTTISDVGPELLGRLMELSEVQKEVLAVVFKIADDNGWLLIDTKDVKAMLQYVSTNSKELSLEYGSLAPQSIASIQRNIVHLEGIGGETFFGEPELDLHDWLATDETGRGIINLLQCVELVQNPLLYSTFLLWMLSDLYEKLPEVGDLEKPKIIFFFDEAHLLFSGAPGALIQKVEQVARLIRSKGVGVYFISQSPGDIPDTVLAQLGNKVQHALRAYTPAEQKAVRAAAASFRPNEAFDTGETIGRLGIGEALVSMLDESGTPTVVERARILPMRSFDGIAPDELVLQRVQASALSAKYATAVDNISAFEVLTGVQEEQTRQKEEAAAQEAAQKAAEKEAVAQQKQAEKEAEQERKKAQRNAEKTQAAIGRVATNTASAIGREVAKGIFRGLFGTRK